MNDAQRAYAEKVRGRAETKEQDGGGFGPGYLILPAGVKKFRLDPKSDTANIDVLNYIVNSPKHPEVVGKRINIGDQWYEFTFYIHSNIGPMDEKVICPTSIGLPCPICEKHRVLSRDETADTEAVDVLRNKMRQLFNVIDLEHFDDGVQVWDCSFYKGFGEKLVKKLRRGPIEWACFAFLSGGMSINLECSKGKFGKGNYAEIDAINFVKREQDYEDSMLPQMIDLDACLDVKPYKELQELLYGTAGAEGAHTEPEKTETTRNVPARRAVPPRQQEAAEPAAPPAATGPRRVPPRPGVSAPSQAPAAPVPGRRSVPPRPAAPPPPEPVTTNEQDEGNDAPPADGEGEMEIPEGMKLCKACEGSGVNSKGAECVPCQGSGLLPDQQETAAPTRRPPARTAAGTTPSPATTPTFRRAPASAPTTTSRSNPPPAPAPTTRRAVPPRPAAPPAEPEAPSEGDGTYECPSGHKFGVDTNDKDECANCDIWQACIDKKEQDEAARQTARTSRRTK